MTEHPMYAAAKAHLAVEQIDVRPPWVLKKDLDAMDRWVAVQAKVMEFVIDQAVIRGDF